MIASMIPAVATLACCQGCCVQQPPAVRASCCPTPASVESVATARDGANGQTVMEVELLALDLSTCDRCTGTDAAIEAAVTDLRPALREAGVELRFRKTVVQTAEQATTLRFQSSPTIRINGRDLPIGLRESRCGDCTTLCGGAASTDCRVWIWRGREYTEAPKGLIVDAILRAYPRAGEPLEPARGEFALPDNLLRFYEAKRGRSAGADETKRSPAQPCCDTKACCAASEKSACCRTDQPTAKGPCGCKPK
jgi:hypothetical protein